jgi:hypothetical protein
MSTQRYRITITPLESDGRPCAGRCTIEFEQRSHENWMRRLEALQGQRRFSGDDCAALTVGTQLLKELAQARTDGHGALARIQPELQALLDRIIETEPRPH